MTFFNVIKCAFCLRWSCPKRYQIGNRTYYSHLGFVRTECPKKLGKYSYLTMDEIKEKAQEEALERKKANEQQEKESQVKNIVIVDDNMDFAQILVDFLKKPDAVESTAYTSPLGVLKYLEENKADILISDYEMPEMNGFELAKEVLQKYPDIRIIVMSGHDNDYLEQICKKYEIYGKVEMVCKSNIDFFGTLVK